MSAVTPPVVAERVAGHVDPLALAADPRCVGALTVTVRGWHVVVANPVAVVTETEELTDMARHCGWHLPVARTLDEPPFVGGAVGYLADDCAGTLLGLPSDLRPPMTPVPPVWFGLYDTAVCIPVDGGPAWLVATDLPALSHHPAPQRLAELRSWVADNDRAAPGPSAWPREEPREETRSGGVRWSLSPAQHAAAVRQAKSWIAAGDLYQLNLTVQGTVDWAETGVTLARRLWAASPDAAHAAYLRLPGGAEIISVSPETFLRTDGNQVAIRPIKGTRPRRREPAADAAQARALRCSDKDRAEHIMIVDLERNDLGRVCEPGTVKVPELMALEAHPTVWHLTSTVCGALRDDVGFGDLVTATFPSGSVTGAPKRMAIERIRALEPVRRGVYCGAIGVVSRGLADFSVGIRTAVLAGAVASYGTGGAIVADSDSDAEWAEARDKAAAFLRATGVDDNP